MKPYEEKPEYISGDHQEFSLSEIENAGRLVYQNNAESDQAVNDTHHHAG